MKTRRQLLLGAAVTVSYWSDTVLGQTPIAVITSQPSICGTFMLQTPYTTTTTISEPAQASSIAAACTYYTGSVEIAPEAQGTMNFTGQLTSIAGDLISNGSRSGIDIVSNSVTLIAGNLFLAGKDGSAAFNFPNLISSTQLTLIDWWPNMTRTSLWRGTSTLYIPEAIIRNTSLTEVHIVTENAPGYTIVNNDVLHVVDLRGTAIGPIVIAGNGAGKEDRLAALRTSSMSVELSRLTKAGDLTISDATAITLTNTASINGSLEIANSTMRTLLLPQLAAVGGSLEITGNADLTTTEALALQSVGGDLKMTNNTLSSSTSFPSLKEVERNFVLDGAFTKINVPVLKQVGDNVTVTSSQDLGCQQLRDSIYTVNSGRVVGSFSCNSRNSSDGTVLGANNGSQQSSNQGSGSLSTGAKIGIGAGVGGGSLLAIIAVFLLFWRRRRAHSEQKRDVEKLASPESKSSTESIRIRFGKAELDGTLPFEDDSKKVNELGSDGERQELHASSKEPSQELESFSAAAKHDRAELDSALPYDSMGGMSELPSPQNFYEMSGDHAFYELPAGQKSKSAIVPDESEVTSPADVEDATPLADSNMTTTVGEKPDALGADVEK